MKHYGVSWTQVQGRNDKFRKGYRPWESDCREPSVISEHLYKDRKGAEDFISRKLNQLKTELYGPSFKTVKVLNKIPYGRLGEVYLVAWRGEEREAIGADFFDMMTIFRIHEFEVLD